MKKIIFTNLIKYKIYNELLKIDKNFDQQNLTMNEKNELIILLPIERKEIFDKYIDIFPLNFADYQPDNIEKNINDFLIPLAQCLNDTDLFIKRIDSQKDFVLCAKDKIKDEENIHEEIICKQYILPMDKICDYLIDHEFLLPFNQIKNLFSKNIWEKMLKEEVDLSNMLLHEGLNENLMIKQKRKLHKI